MAKQLQLRRGTTSQHSTFTGANGEATVDSTKKTIVVHDGSTAGGFPLAKQGETSYTINVVSDFISIPSNINTVILKDDKRGGIFNKINTTTANDGTIFNGSGCSWKRLYTGDILIDWFGAIGDGSDDTVPIRKALSSLQNGDTLNFNGKECSVYNTVSGVTSGDAIPLSDCIRVYGKSNITLKNGRIYAYNPSASATKYRFPSTLTLDGCTSCVLENFKVDAKGESWGDIDASAPLSHESRRAFGAQNGGHAILVVRSLHTTLNNVRALRAGSCGTIYMMSSNNTILNNCYSSPMSLGYASYACDAWAGGTSVSGFTEHYTELNNCHTDNNNSTYGSKNGILGEDIDTIIKVNGGSYKDSYANGANHDLGGAFGISSGTLNVQGAIVNNCASVGYTSNTNTNDTVLNIVNVKATNIRTSAHIQSNRSFGKSIVNYVDCDITITGTALWSEPELSKSTVFALMKVTSEMDISYINCKTVGADTFLINTKTIYGGITIKGGTHTLQNRIFDTVGFGGASVGTYKGFTIKNGADFIITNTILSQAVTNNAYNDVSVITNKDVNNVYTYLYLHFGYDCKLICQGTGIKSAIVVNLQGSELKEKCIDDMAYINCYTVDAIDVGTELRKNKELKVISLNGVAGSFVKVTFLFPENRAVADKFVDSTMVIRDIESAVSAVDITNNDVRQQVYINGTSYNVTSGVSYPVII